MIKEDEKKVVLNAVRVAKLAAIKEQSEVSESIALLLQATSRFSLAANFECMADGFWAIAGNSPPNNNEWLISELDQITDVEVQGTLGIYTLTIDQLNYLKASHAFLKVLTECN